MMTQRRLDEIKVTAKFRVNRMLARFYESYYGQQAMMSAAQPQQPPPPPMGATAMVDTSGAQPTPPTMGGQYG